MSTHNFYCFLANRQLSIAGTCECVRGESFSARGLNYYLGGRTHFVRGSYRASCIFRVSDDAAAKYNLFSMIFFGAGAAGCFFRRIL